MNSETKLQITKNGFATEAKSKITTLDAHISQCYCMTTTEVLRYLSWLEEIQECLKEIKEINDKLGL